MMVTWNSSKIKSMRVWSLSHSSQYIMWCRISSAAVTATVQPNPFIEIYICFTNSLTWSWKQNWRTDGYRSEAGSLWASSSLFSALCRPSLQQPLMFQLSPACLLPQTSALNRVNYSSVAWPSEGCLGLFWCLTNSEFWDAQVSMVLGAFDTCPWRCCNLPFVGWLKYQVLACYNSWTKFLEGINTRTICL